MLEVCMVAMSSCAFFFFLSIKKFSLYSPINKELIIKKEYYSTSFRWVKAKGLCFENKIYIMFLSHRKRIWFIWYDIWVIYVIIRLRNVHLKIDNIEKI